MFIFILGLGFWARYFRARITPDEIAYNNSDFVLENKIQNRFMSIICNQPTALLSLGH